jgi:hypothetical protein
MAREPAEELGHASSQLIMLPFRLTAKAWRGRRAWRAVPLDVKSHIRLRAATFVLVVLIGASAFGVIPYDNSWEFYGAAGAACYALLNLAAGLIGVRYAARLRWDPLSIWWWSVGAAACAALLIYAEMQGW